MSEEHTLPKVVCLGPLGTYSHQAGYEQFGDNVEYIERSSIRAVLDAVSSEIPFGLLPQENTIFGAVIEGYDALRSPAVGSSVFVRGEVVLPVQHCLIARKGVQFEQIERIISHEQALGQCTGFIAKHFPNVTLEKKPSTAAAARTLLEDDEMSLRSAAICSSLCAKIFDGLEVLQRSVQDTNINYTRFYVLAYTIDARPPVVRRVPQLRRALVRITLPPAQHTEQPAVSDGEDDEPTTPKPAHSRSLHLIMGTLLTTFGVPVIRIDRRPSASGCPFEDTYFIELEDFGTPVEPPVTGNSPADEAWLKKVRNGVAKVNAVGGLADVIGVW
ncbi:PDT-domain-containing protein [Phanerochaete sordida]|uniref:PDT-domain-containing protein n=1 Tax=Phanerochaete sordida TaxID=48140 RepID=A0A9P3LAK7_9APHY|nr:PDT-domain-containing protein [Phanerochaete sordida]